MEVQNYSLRSANERETSPRRRNYYEDADGSPTTSMRSKRKEKQSITASYEKHAAPPSLTEQMRQSSFSRRKPLQKDSLIGDSANKCIQNDFGISSAKSIAYSLVNPCGLTTIELEYSNIGGPLPTTPSTVGSSFSDDSQSDSGQNFPGRLESIRSFLPLDGAQVNAKDGDIVIFVGNQEYRFPSSGGSVNFASKYFVSRREKAKHFSFVNLSTHSPEEFKIVMKFFDNNPARDAWSNIHWKNLPVILPWFVEFQALPLMSAVDTFLLQNGFSAPGDRGYRGDNNNHKRRHISLSSLLALMQIAFDCRLESTKLHSRRLLRRCLLEPRKQTNPDLDNSRNSEAAEDIELEWTLKDLQVLAKLLKTHNDLREYLWEVAVIVYLPHDLDVSDSAGLVSNILFPYLLREGMMQMMIVEGIENSYQTTDNSFLTESSGTPSIMSYNKGIGTSFSEHTSCSDATIPTTPTSQLKYLTEKEIHQYLKKMIKQLEKFKAEKEARATVLEDRKGYSLVADEAGGVQKPRSRRGYTGTENQGSTKTPTSRGVSTFAC